MEFEEEQEDVERVKSAIEEGLNKIADPGSGARLMDMGLVRNVAVDNGVARLTFRPSSTVCPVAFSLAPRIKEIVEETRGVSRVIMKIENFNRAEELMALLRDD